MFQDTVKFLRIRSAFGGFLPYFQLIYFCAKTKHIKGEANKMKTV